MTLPFRLLRKQLGPRPLAHYLRYQLLLRSGTIRRRTPMYRWEDPPRRPRFRPGELAESARRLLTVLKPLTLERLQLLQSEAERPAVAEADEILRGEFRLFGGQPQSLGFPPQWLQVPLEGASGPMTADAHWTSHIADSKTDFRLLWELSRFGWAYPLARAYLLSQQPRYVDAFFELLSSWREANPPNAGPNWISAQEAGLRIMALCFAWWAFERRLKQNMGQAAMLLTTIDVNAKRIPPTLAYSQAQRNNHLITEAVGLYTAGVQFPFIAADRWHSTGRRLLIDALEDQVLADGGYIQHSTNYHRLALSAGLWMAQLAQVNGRPLPEATLTALRRMTIALAAVVDPQSGRVPNLGSNDGSDILPLSGCAPADYRPVVQAAALAFTGDPAFPPGTWDETALWLGLDPPRGADYSGGRDRAAAAAVRSGAPGQARGPNGETTTAMPDNTASEFPQAGLYLLRNPTSWAALRCARFTSRPSQSDQLHLDLWWQGHNIARDPGSYRYTVSGLEGALAHNTLTVDGQEPMQRVRQFLWLARHEAEYLGRWRSDDGRVESMAAEQRLPGGLLHRRSVVCAADTLWVVIDELAGAGEHAARLAWLLPDWEWELQDAELRLRGGPEPLQLHIEGESASLALYRAGKQIAGAPAEEPEQTVGWWAPSYGRRQPALSLIARVRASLPLRLASWWRLGEPDLSPELADGPLAEFFANGG